MEQINFLREENVTLRARLQKLELSVAQKQAEVQSWMTRIEKHIAQGRELPP
ncbi:hypothetical protein LPJ70_007250 [Coemansia sp. RSA 2708]|nr:hypothetical protein LPJ70_007250 [Coemansia sp. RSA 2708]